MDARLQLVDAWLVATAVELLSRELQALFDRKHGVDVARRRVGAGGQRRRERDRSDGGDEGQMFMGVLLSLV